MLKERTLLQGDIICLRLGLNLNESFQGIKQYYARDFAVSFVQCGYTIHDGLILILIYSP